MKTMVSTIASEKTKRKYRTKVKNSEECAHTRDHYSVVAAAAAVFL